MRYRAGRVALFAGPLLASSVVACSGRASSPEVHSATQTRVSPIQSIKPPLSPAEERARIRRQFAGSGPSTEPWTKEAGGVFARKAGSIQLADQAVQYSAAECFAGGCLVTATYPDLRRFAESSRSFSESDVFQTWPGTKYRSPPEVMNDGKVVATWGLFRPVARDSTEKKGGR